jgi:anti-sigma B factor antagonist
MTRDPSIEQAEHGIAVVVLQGEQETFQAERLQPRLAALLEQGAGIVVDLSRTTFVDSTTLGVLLTAQREARKAGSAFVLEMDESTAFHARRIFEITGVGSLFSIAGTRAEAVAAARGGQAGAQPQTEPA